jgi:23S rRNA-intervening sequence protein
MQSSEFVSPADEFDIRLHVDQIAQHLYRLTASSQFKDHVLREELQNSAGLMQTACLRAFEAGDQREICRLLGMTRGKAGRLRGSIHLCVDLDLIEESEFDAMYLLLLRLSDRLHRLMVRLRELDPDPEPWFDLEDLPPEFFEP